VQLIERDRPLLAMMLAGAFLATTTMGAVARADDDACIAASENEIPLRKQDKLKDALAQLAICASRTCPEQISAECGRRIREINAIQPTLVLGAMDSSSNDVVAVTVTVDGAPFATALDGRAVPLDPGVHQLRFESAGMTPLDKTLVVREGEKDRRVNVVLQRAGSLTPTAVSAVNQSAEAHKTYAEIAWGAGGIGLIVGAFAGLYALETGVASSACNGGVCGAAGSTVSSASSTATDVAIAGLTLAAVGGITGTILWFTAPARVRVTTAMPVTLAPMIGQGATGVLVGGRF
jgi:hypothetical protein